MGLELVLELVAETAKTKKRENLTFLPFYFFENDTKKPSARHKNLTEGSLLCFLVNMNPPLAIYDIIVKKRGALMEIRNVGNRIMNTWIYPLLTKNKQHIDALNLRPLKHK